MGKINRYAPEVRDRAIRMVTDHRGEYPSQWAAIQSVSQKLGMTPETLRAWVRRAEIDNGKRDGVTTAEAERIKARERKRVARLLIEDVTIIKTDKIHLHVRFRGGKTTSLSVAIPPTGWQARQTNPDTLATLDRLLDTHTDSQAAEALNRAGHISGMAQAFTPSIVLHLRRRNGLSSHLERLRSNGLLTATEFAERLGVSMSTVKAWNRAGLLISYQANDKNTRLFAPPTPGDPRLVKKMGSSLAKRALTQP